MIKTALLLAAAALAASGCKEQGPVELIDDGLSGTIEIVSPPPTPMPGMELGDEDSAGIVPLPPEKISGHILVAGARYDGPLFSAEANVSRAIFLDRSSPVHLSMNRITYHTIDVGSVDLNGTPLLEVDKRVRFMSIDTLLGPQYVLYNRWPDGFRYAGGELYRWTGTGNEAVSPFTADIVAPPAIVVQNLTPSTAIPLDEGLRIRWTGGGATVQLVISQAGDLRVDARPILHLRLGPNRGGIVIPPRILALLPHDRNRFIFTFFSGAAKIARIDGYPDDVLVQALTSHSIAVQVSR
ncbi:MAG TPA: hypothetical protein VI932_01685 [Bacteroidota bacterium]|nr:hypothetical protein [Bacteroidota bacterium]